MNNMRLNRLFYRFVRTETRDTAYQPWHRAQVPRSSKSQTYQIKNEKSFDYLMLKQSDTKRFSSVFSTINLAPARFGFGY